VDVVGFGDTEVGVEGESLAPVVAGLIEIAAGVVGVGESVVGAGLLVSVAVLDGQSEGSGVVGACLAKLPSGTMNLTDTVECAGFSGLVADLAEQG